MGLIRFALAFLLVLVPTALMGGTLPVLGKYFVRRLPRVGRSVGVLYAANTFGATAGTVAVAFVLLERLGVRGTVFVAAGLNFAVAGVSWLLAPLTTDHDWLKATIDRDIHFRHRIAQATAIQRPFRISGPRLQR